MAQMPHILSSIELLPLPDGPGLRVLIGILAAVAAMACWVFTSLAFTIAGRRYGSTTVNVSRSILATVVLLVAVRLLAHSWMPIQDGEQILWLALSGAAGLALGDQLIFSAFNRVGPRLTLLVLNLAPVFTALIAWPILGEQLAILAWLGMAITVVGVGWVVSEKPNQTDPSDNETILNPKLGIALAFSGTVAVSIGNALAKLGMLGDGPQASLDPLIAQNVRMIAGVAAIVLMAGIASALGKQIGSPKEPDPAQRPSRKLALTLLFFGTIFGPVLGIWFFLVSAVLIKLALTTTILALTPIAILPFSRLVERTPISQRAVLGAIIAVVGVGVLSFSEYRPGDQEKVPPQTVDFEP